MRRLHRATGTSGVAAAALSLMLHAEPLARLHRDDVTWLVFRSDRTTASDGATALYLSTRRRATEPPPGANMY